MKAEIHPFRIVSKIVSQTRRSWRMNGRGVSVLLGSGKNRPRCRGSGSPEKQPREKEGTDPALSNLKNSNLNPSDNMQSIGRENADVVLLRSHPKVEIGCRKVVQAHQAYYHTLL